MGLQVCHLHYLELCGSVMLALYIVGWARWPSRLSWCHLAAQHPGDQAGVQACSPRGQAWPWGAGTEEMGMKQPGFQRSCVAHTALEVMEAPEDVPHSPRVTVGSWLPYSSSSSSWGISVIPWDEGGEDLT